MQLAYNEIRDINRCFELEHLYLRKIDNSSPDGYINTSKPAAPLRCMRNSVGVFLYGEQ